MNAHDHSTFVDGCYRCDISRDEVSFRVDPGDPATIERVAKVLFQDYRERRPRMASWSRVEEAYREDFRALAAAVLGALAAHTEDESDG